MSLTWAHARVLLLATALFACSAGGVQAATEQDRTPERQFFSVFVFGCYFPIPNDYVLNTRERQHFSFLQHFDSGSGIIDISTKRRYEEPFGSGVVINRERRGQSLSVAKYEIGPQHFGLEKGSPRRAAIVDDGKVFLAVIGPDSELVDFMVEQCLATMN